MDILNEIQEKFSTFSKGQKRIAQYILDKTDQAALMTASALGKIAQVSESTVVRFASEMGYRGYPEMQKALQDIVLSHLTLAQRLEDMPTGEETFLSRILREDAERIRITQENIDAKNFDRVVQEMSQARRIYIIGAGAACALASFLHYYLQYIFEDVRLITSAATSMESLLRLSPQELVFAIGFQRYSASLLQAMQYANNVGATTIALTDSENLCDVDFLLTAKTDRISKLDSLVAPMSVINALIAASMRVNEQELVFDKLEEVSCHEKYDN